MELLPARIRARVCDYIHLLHPLQMARALHRGRYTYEAADVTATFDTGDLWSVLSLFHTLRTESTIFEDLNRTLASDDVFYDVGAHHGAFTCVAGGIVAEGEVVAFEPHPGNAAQLRRNVALNHSPARVVECALADRERTGRLSPGGWRPKNQRPALVDTGQDGATVDVRRGDRFVEDGEVPAPTVIKIDVEGAELDVIDGMRSVLERDACRVVYCELHPGRLARCGAAPEDVEHRLESAGFTVAPLQTCGPHPHLRAEKG